MKKLLCLLLAVACYQTQAAGPVLTIDGGKVEGVKADLKGVYVYRGIPYAAPPIKALRWKAPQPVVPWQGVKIADKFGHPGYQAVHYPGGYTTEWGYGDESPYSEDCLYLNVWTTAPGKTDKKLPVALWIHGGGYREGWGSEPEFDGQEWGNKNVVLVSINYRLGVFGFLTHPDLSKESPNHVSGNYGILDQIESLKWIKKNIAQFGGDPDNVTIFGQSAGAGSVKVLCESPLARGLFNKAIIMSGGGLNTGGGRAGGRAGAGGPGGFGGRGGFGPVTREQGEQQTKEVMDWAGLTNLDRMRAASTETIYTVGSLYTAATGKQARITGAPIVDGYVSMESFDAAALDGKLANVPYMIGYTLNDLGNMSQGIGDFCLNRQNAGNKAYAYEFARPLPTDGRPNVLVGAFHSSDLWYVFKSLQHCWRPLTPGDWQLAEVELTAWSNFAKYGDPNGNGKTPVKWAAYTKENPKLMIFKLDASSKEASAMGDPIPWATAPR
ncbi:MAG TPA: carboxylesterase family protein [Verrucomicrobiae bacterium]|nr:carboxylesterase family protein [Verrucomicrobiae bacterium]